MCCVYVIAHTRKSLAFGEDQGYMPASVQQIADSITHSIERDPRIACMSANLLHTPK